MDTNRRITEKLLRYWLKLRSDKQFPNESELDIDHLSDIWDSCFLVEMRSPGVFRYNYLGRNLIEAYGGDVTNEEISKKLVSPYTERVAKKFAEVVAARKPIKDDAEFIDSKNLQIKYRQILLPLGDSTGELKYILGGMRWKHF